MKSGKAEPVITDRPVTGSSEVIDPVINDPETLKSVFFVMGFGGESQCPLRLPKAAEGRRSPFANLGSSRINENQCKSIKIKDS